ncbi:type II toxin-antitoxin system PemK/MazF family toxin [Rothia nasimurium]|uniref:type II toxin-antitoxin system PemK/MazF family toxin n=1 Tax=Rothia nasimurium TaxID=85336 RepID=UPI003B9EDEA2
MELEVQEGELWWAKPDATVGREQSGRRPVLIISNPFYNRLVDTLAIAVPLTSQERGWSNHVLVPPGCGLGKDSWAMTEQVRTISRRRLAARIGAVDATTLAEVRRWVKDFL